MKNKIKISIVGLVSVLCFTGCLTNENISKDFTAGSIGCKPEKISIVNEKATMSGMHTWTAYCNNKEYFCTYHYGDGAKCSEVK
ncbi:hypothetical protein [Aliarcobacter butzleri]|uniref:Lipoprotein n=1 Tax=Aliarcobacter butzleri TaxID=28197 RepID=A0AAW6VS01_9BACT|nr:hypothetical protein [Aliarcobacter butzleri]MDK2063055.1 hypothetical protein [Aliarcobacter butzleri]MDK2080748.1 hypothetical protein [Aliarcobacter butzleri]MDK2091805.1 hypothetical protein [Aliarcobacter butzleri]NUW26461.1 hypothetical protein [Aliarcobacter butzleri]NUW28655.1 hypothetical protein [Aliarcobacter butzleri]